MSEPFDGNYMVYCPDLEDKDESVKIKALTAVGAAEEYARRSYRDEPWDSPMDVRVLTPGKERRFWVEPIPEVVFRSVEWFAK